MLPSGGRVTSNSYSIGLSSFGFHMVNIKRLKFLSGKILSFLKCYFTNLCDSYFAKLLFSCIYVISNIFGSFWKVILMYVYSIAEFYGTM